MDQTTHNGIVPKVGWSWGAFMSGFYFLIATKKYQYLWWYLLAIVPFLNIIFFIGFAIYLGVNGHMIGATGNQFDNQTEYDGYMKGVDHAGKIMFFIVLAMIALGIIFIIAIAALAPSMFHNSGSMDNYQPQMNSLSY